MCLEHPFSTKPYNHSNIRYKILRTKRNSRPHRSFYSWWYPYDAWKFNKWLKSTMCDYLHKDEVPVNEGFHVFVNLKDAVRALRGCWKGTELIIVKIQVKGFNTAGYWRGARSETWCCAKIIKVYNDY